MIKPPIQSQPFKQSDAYMGGNLKENQLMSSGTTSDALPNYDWEGLINSYFEGYAANPEKWLSEASRKFNLGGTKNIVGVNPAKLLMSGGYESLIQAYPQADIYQVANNTYQAKADEAQKKLDELRAQYEAATANLEKQHQAALAAASSPEARLRVAQHFEQAFQRLADEYHKNKAPYEETLNRANLFLSRIKKATGLSKLGAWNRRLVNFPGWKRGDMLPQDLKDQFPFKPLPHVPTVKTRPAGGRPAISSRP